MQDKPVITVFTATYNRANLLPRVYQGLRRQTFRRFEWVIVDDGSKDNTGELVQGWAKEADFPIRYFHQANSGKYTASNRGAAEARGDYFVNHDSDDWLADDGLERMLAAWEGIPAAQREGFSHVTGLMAYPDGKVVGTRFPRSPLDSDAAELAAVYGVQGDKFGCCRIEVFRAFPWPVEEGRDPPCAIKWHRMARAYKQRFVNEVWAHADYQSDGMSARSVNLRVRSARATWMYYLEAVQLFSERRYPLPKTLRHAVNFVRFAFHDRVPPLAQLRQLPSAALWAASALPGLALYLRDLRRLGGERGPRGVGSRVR